MEPALHWDAQLAALSRGRLRAASDGQGRLVLSDRLRPGRLRAVPPMPAAGAESAPALLDLVREGFLDAALPAATGPIGSRPSAPGDAMFWQFPARTEAAAHERHAQLARAAQRGAQVHVYLGLPWATWIDTESRRGALPEIVEHEMLMQRVRIGGYARVLRALGAELRVHTVCQHIRWRNWLPRWRSVGITDLWLSHAPAAAEAAVGLTLHPWPLYAVNVEDAARRHGIDAGRDPAERSVLASFVGAHAAHYLSDCRLRLRSLAGEPGLHIEVNEQWHFEDVVYRQQIGGEAPAPDAAALDDAVRRYNALLSDSVFSLCPAGTGPNTLRLWESLAAGAVPVLLGPAPRLPAGGTLAPIDWDAIVLRVADGQIAELPRILAGIPLEERRRRRQLGLQAYARVREQRCF